MHDFKFSIITPHYNIPHLLNRCLKSIPVREDIQVIVIDDCSDMQEKLFDICPELSRPYLEFYSTPIGGSAGRAKNIGIDKAKGKWLIFLDADDFLVEGAFDILDKYYENAADILFFNYLNVYSDNLSKKGNRTKYQHYFKQFSLDGNEIPFRYEFEPMWCKIIRNEVVKKYNIKCNEIRSVEDMFFSIQIGFYAKEIKILDKPLFVITERENSLASHQFSSDKNCSDYYVMQTNEAFKSQQFLLKHGVKHYIPSFKASFVTFFKHYPLVYIKTILGKVFQYPHLCYCLSKIWLRWKMNALIHLFKNKL